MKDNEDLHHRQMNALEVEHMDTSITEKSTHGISIWLNDRDMTVNFQFFINPENVKTWSDLTI